MLQGLNIYKWEITNHAIALAFSLPWHNGRELPAPLTLRQ